MGTDSGDKPALQEVEDVIRVFLRNWEDSDVLPSDAAHDLAELVLGHGRLQEAHRQVLAVPRQLDQVGPRRRGAEPFLGAG